MLEKVHQLAERAATSVSRRQFLGRFAAGAAAAALGGLLAAPARAGRGRGVCSDDSDYAPCRGQPIGSYCSFAGGGKCWSAGGAGGPIEVSPGVYNCNQCKVGGRKPRGRS